VSLTDQSTGALDDARERYLERHRRYNQSEKGQARVARYENSDKGMRTRYLHEISPARWRARVNRRRRELGLQRLHAHAELERLAELRAIVEAELVAELRGEVRA
jgi:hypothetical protein